MTYKQLQQTLNNFSVTQQEETTEFDPNLHESFMVVKDPKKQNNQIAFILQRGYLLNGALLRSQKVALVKN